MPILELAWESSMLHSQWNTSIPSSVSFKNLNQMMNFMKIYKTQLQPYYSLTHLQDYCLENPATAKVAREEKKKKIETLAIVKYEF